MSKPYLEVKVVKVRKEEKQNYCFWCGGKIEMEKPKGNWVNGENLDKIEFPFFCSFGKRSQYYGMVINTLMDYIECETAYLLFSIDRQNKNITSIDRDHSLENLINVHNIKILKAKIILFEEE
ncbi:hypothetical protein KAX08_00440 [candidate division WOR-3 bacterium]|nr:hypothetical protein [candidate division WOR-3 bacterium]